MLSLLQLLNRTKCHPNGGCTECREQVRLAWKLNHCLRDRSHTSRNWRERYAADDHAIYGTGSNALSCSLKCGGEYLHVYWEWL